jgi:hypothetical protein
MVCAEFRRVRYRRSMPRGHPIPQAQLSLVGLEPSPELPAVDHGGAKDEAAPEPNLSVGRRGRPRIWESEAERKRAYRDRKARDLAEPERLRRELRNARKQIANRDREISRLRSEARGLAADFAAAVHRSDEPQESIHELEREVEKWRSRSRNWRVTGMFSMSANDHGPTGAVGLLAYGPRCVVAAASIRWFRELARATDPCVHPRPCRDCRIELCTGTRRSRLRTNAHVSTRRRILREAKTYVNGRPLAASACPMASRAAALSRPLDAN